MRIRFAILLITLSAGVSAFSASAPALSSALDGAGLVWTTSATYPWVGVTDVTLDGTDSATCGNRFVANSVSWLQTTVVGPGTLSFWWKVASVDPDQLEFYINDEPQEAIFDLVDWSYRAYALGPGTNVVRWQYVKDEAFNSGTDRGWLDQVNFVPGAPMPLQEALNTCGAVWTSGGNENPTVWHGQTNLTHDASKAAQSGAITHLQQSWLQTTVSGVTNVSFWWRVSSEYDSRSKVIYDTLGFYIDDVLQANISVEEQWEAKSFALSANSHTLRWVYAKDDSDMLPKGQDCAWVDQVVFGPTLKALPYTLQRPVLLPNGTVQITVSGESGCGCGLQVSTNLVAWQPLTNFTSPSATTTILDTPPLGATMRFYRAVSP